jgi:hypothetical protein
MAETSTAAQRKPRLSLDWWAAQIGVSRRKLNSDIAAKKLRAVRLGRRTVVQEEDMQLYLDAHATMPRRRQ